MDEIISGGEQKWRVVAVKALDEYKLELDFVSGEKKIYDASGLVEKPAFVSLKNPGLFMQAQVVGDTVGWPGDIQIAPEALYNVSTPIK